MTTKQAKRKTNAKTKPIIYTSDVVLAHVQRLYLKLMADESIIFLKQLFRGDRLYSELYSRFRKRYKNNMKICHAIKEIDDEIESRLVERGLLNKTNSTLTIFCLKNNYGWGDETITQLKGEKDERGNAVPLEIVIRGHKD